jgi:hypothetical protein
MVTSCQQEGRLYVSLITDLTEDKDLDDQED